MRGHLNSTMSRDSRGLTTLPVCSSKTARCVPAEKDIRQRSGPPIFSRRPASSNRNKDHAPAVEIVTGSACFASVGFGSVGFGSVGFAAGSCVWASFGSNAMLD
jgi:hypothetical protein